MKSAVQTFLGMNPGKDFNPSFPRVEGLAIARLETCPPEFYLYLYTSVGKPYGWKDRLAWSSANLAHYLKKPGLSIYVALVHGKVAGYIELLRGKRETKIAYFGLSRPFHGKGIGKHLLSFGIQKALREKARRITVNTLTTDGPYALANYLSRGFRIERQKKVTI